ncbi:MAG: flavin reductase family protein [Promethearchaeota archaeon]
MFKDLKKFTEAQKARSLRAKYLPEPEYHDDLEPLLRRIHPGHQWVEVSDIEQLSRDTKLFRLVPAKSTRVLAPFRAGAYVGLTVEVGGVRTTRPYSIASSPNQLAYYELGIKKKEGGFVSWFMFDRAKVGDKFQVTEPMGNLRHNLLFHGKKLVFIAGGSGITPFTSLMRDFAERRAGVEVWLVYGALTEEDLLFRDVLEDIQARRPNLRVEFVLSEPDSGWIGKTGFITGSVLKDVVGGLDDKFFYVVGNRAMYDFVLHELEDLGVPRHRVTSEAFGVPDDVTKVVGWPEGVDGTREVEVTVELVSKRKVQVVKARCTEPLLNSLERAKIDGLQVDTGCRSGECALCRTRLLSGKVFVPPEVKTREADRSYGFIHPCVSYPLEDLHVQI